jgi:hypothetical protein
MKVIHWQIDVQGDQIGRSFARLGRLIKISKYAKFSAYFFHFQGHVVILSKNGMGYILGDFF